MQENTEDFEPERPHRPQIGLALMVEGSLAVAALALAWLLGIRPWQQVDTSFLRAVVRGIAATLPMLLVLWFLVRSSAPGLVELRKQVAWLVNELLGGATITQLALIAAVAGFGEELLFRGVLQPLVDRYTTPFVAVLSVSIVFGLLHALSRLYFLFATLVSIYLGWLAWQYGDLISPMLAHALYDFVALLYFRKPLSEPLAAEI